MRLLQHDIDALRRRRPQPKSRGVVCRAGAELPVVHAAPVKASTDRGGALASAPEAYPVKLCTASVVFSIVLVYVADYFLAEWMFGSSALIYR